MKVDMSPEAVSSRLRTMDDLWQLSVKLMKSERIARNAPLSKKQRALKIQESIRRILFDAWDPIGINDESGIDHEYDVYIGPVYRKLSGGCSEVELVRFLLQLETGAMGLQPRSADLLQPVAQKLIGLQLHMTGNLNG